MKKTVGLVETVEIIGKTASIKRRAKFDTGAQTCSIDKALAKKIGTGKLVKYVNVTSASSQKGVKRAVYKMKVKINGKDYNVDFNLADRSKMKYKILIGRNLIHKNFIVDVSKSHKSFKDTDLKVGYL